MNDIVTDYYKCQHLATTFSFINPKSTLHVSGDKFAHPQEHSFWLCIQLLVHCTDTAADRQQSRCIVPKAVYIVKKSASEDGRICRTKHLGWFKNINKRKICRILLVTYILLLVMHGRTNIKPAICWHVFFFLSIQWNQCVEIYNIWLICFPKMVCVIQVPNCCVVRLITLFCTALELCCCV